MNGEKFVNMQHIDNFLELASDAAMAEIDLNQRFPKITFSGRAALLLNHLGQGGIVNARAYRYLGRNRVILGGVACPERGRRRGLFHLLQDDTGIGAAI